jgi:hypothetical protein
LLQYDEQLPEDLDTRGEDHVADEARYFLMSRPIAPRLEKSAEAAQGASQLFLDIPHKNLPPARISPKMEFL